MKHLFATVMTALVGLCCIACGRSIENYGEVPTDLAERTPISAILLSPKEYVGKVVVIEGVIETECPTGGWILVADKEGHKIYVEFHGAEFAPIPQRVGSVVVAKGVVFQSEGQEKEIKLLGKGIGIR
jgi:hypothetical protein